MFLFEKKLKNVAKDTDKYLDKFLKQQELGSNLLKPMRYGLFSGGKKFRSKIIVDTGKIFNIDYNSLISVFCGV